MFVRRIRASFDLHRCWDVYLYLLWWAAILDIMTRLFSMIVVVVVVVGLTTATVANSTSHSTEQRRRTAARACETGEVFTTLSSSLSSSAQRMLWVDVAQQHLQPALLPNHAHGRLLPWWVSSLPSLLENSSLSQIPLFCCRSDPF